MSAGKMKTGIKLLIFFYGFIIFQHFSMRRHFSMNSMLEAVFIGTLVYLIWGFIRRENNARRTGIAFHALFQIMETVTVFVFLDPRVFSQLVKAIPGATPGVTHVTVAVVFALITAVNVGAAVYLWRNEKYFSGGRETEETG
jgi:hypothetical protein